MAKTRGWIVVLTCIAGLMLAVSCTTPPNVLRLSCKESGWYPIDVATWVAVKGLEGEITYYPVYNDATVKISAMYTNPGLGMPTYPTGHAIHLTRYTLSWKSSVVKIPRITNGALDVIVESDLSGGTTVDFDLMVMPAVNKDTVSAIADLLGDPESDPNTFVGQVVVPAEITITGNDVLTDEEISATVTLTAAIADYQDPNSYH